MSINFSVRWADNTKDFVRNMREGLDQIEVNRAAVDKLSNSLAGTNVTKSANNWVAALDKMGGATGALGGVMKLTSAETERAIGVFDRAIAKAEAMGKGNTALTQTYREMSAALHETTDAATGWGNILSEMGHSWAARIAEGMLLRDAVRAVIEKVKELAVALPEIALKGAAVADVEEAFVRLTSQAGRFGATLMGELKTGTHNTITDFNLMKTANQDLAAGMNLTDKQFGTLAKGAYALAQATGTDVKAGLETMNDAMLTGRTRALALLTGKIDLVRAEEDYAKSLGSTVEHLTPEGKLEAARVAILKAVGDATERLGEQTEGLDERVAQAGVAWDNFKENLGKAIATSTVLEAGMSGLRDALTDAFGPKQDDLIKAIAQHVDDAAIAFISLAKAGVESGGFIIKEFYAVQKVFGDIIQIAELGALGIERMSLSVAEVLQKTTFGEASKKYGDDVLRITANIKSLTDAIRERGKALQEADRNQAAVGTTTDKYIVALDAIQAKMVAARAVAESFVGPIEAGANAQKHAADTAGQHAGMLQASKEELAKARKAAEEYATAWENLNSLGQSNEDTLAGLNPKIREQASYYAGLGATIADLTKAFPGLTEAQAKALESSAKAGNATTAAWTELNSIGVSYQDTVAQIDVSLVTQVQGFLKAGASVELLAKAYTDKLTPAQIKAIDEAVKANDRLVLSWQKAEDDITALWDKAYALKQQDNLRGLALEQSKIDATATAEYNAWIKRFDEDKANETQLAEAGLAISAAANAAKAKNATDWARKGNEEIAALELQDQQVRIAMYGTQLDAALAANRAELSAHLAKLDEEGRLDAAHEEATVRLYQDRAQAIILAQDPLFRAWQGLNVDMRQEWANTLAAGMTSFSAFGKAFEDTLIKSMWDPFKNVLAGMLADFESILLSPLLGALRQAETAFINWAVNAGLSTAGVGGGGTNYGGMVMNAGVGLGGKAALGLLSSAGTGAFVGPMAATAGTGMATTSVTVPASLAANSSALGTAGIIGAAGGIAGIGIGSWLLGQYLGSKIENKTAGALMGAGAGAATGAAVGSVVPGIGTAIGAGVGAIAGAIAGWRAAGKAYEEVKKQQADLMTQLGGMEGEIKNVGDAYALTGHSGEEAQKALHAMWDAKTPEAFAAAVKPVAEALQALQQNTEDLKAATTDATGRISEAWIRVTDLNKKYGSNLKEVQAFQQQQAGVVMQGFIAVEGAQQDAISGYDAIKKAVDDAQKSVDALIKSGTTGSALDTALATLAGAKTNQAAAGKLAAPELGDLGAQAVGAFTLARGTGSSRSDALKAESAALTALEQEYKDLGLTVEDVALKELFAQNDAQKAIGTLSAGIDGVTQQMVGLDNVNLETADTFSSQQRTAAQMYTRVQAAVDATAKANGDLSDQTKQALLPMQDYLHQAEIEAKKLNVPLDEMTQQMIDQSKDAGIWQDAIKPKPTVQNAIQTLADTVDDLARALRGLPPKVHTDVTVNTTTTTSIGGPPENNPTDSLSGFLKGDNPNAPVYWPASVPKFASGSGGLLDFGTGTLAVLHGQEEVRTAAQIAASTVSNTSSSSRTAVLQESFTFNVTLPPGGVPSDYVEKTLMPQVMGIIEDRRRGYTGRLRRALEVPS